MKKNYILILTISGILFFSCSKDTFVPVYTPAVSTNFTVTSMNHTKDTVNVGDTILLNVVGTMYDTLAVYTYITIKSTASGSPVYSYGSSSSPIKISTVLGSENVTGVNPWTSTIKLIGYTSIANSKLTISANFIYQLSLSSEGGGLASATDGGVANKTVFIQ